MTGTEPRARDAAATRARILDAAVAEFSHSGFAGGRVDRIARAADCNVRMIYAYFGGKSGLFDACFRHVVATMAADIPPRADDLPGWAADLVEYHARRPEALRISMWAQLERPEPAAEPLEDYAAKVAALASAATRELTSTDLLVIIYAIAQSWQLSPAGLTAQGGADAASALADRRRAASAAVARLVAP
jgi:AcrR family transcriptional regulator